MESSGARLSREDRAFIRFGLIVLAILLFAWIFLSETPWPIGSRVFLLACLACVPLLKKVHTGRGPLLDPVSVFAVTFFINYGWSSLLNYSGIVAGLELRHIIPDALDLAMAGLILYFVGYWLPFGSALGRSLPAPWSRLSDEGVQNLASACLGITTFYLLASALGYRWLITFLGSFDWITLGLATILAYRPKPPRRGFGSRRWHAWLLLLVAVFQGFNTGFRGMFVLPVVVFLVAIHFARGRFPWVSFALFTVIAFTVIMPLAHFYKIARQGHEMSIAESIQYTVDQSRKVDLKQYSDSMTQTLIRRYGIMPIFAPVTHKAGVVVPFQRGKTYKHLFTSFIPRFLWRDKPVLASFVGNELPRKFGIIGERDTKTSVGMGLMGEGYINFGLVGLLAVMLFYGVLSRMLNDWLLTRPGVTAVDSALFLPVFWVIANQEGTVVVNLTGLAKLLVVFVAVGWVVSGTATSARSSALRPSTWPHGNRGVRSR